MNDGVLYAYGCFSTYHNDYTATPEEAAFVLNGKGKEKGQKYNYLLNMTFCAGSDDKEDTDKGLYIITTDTEYSEEEMGEAICEANKLCCETNGFSCSYEYDGLNIDTLMNGVAQYIKAKIKPIKANGGNLPDIANFYEIEQWQ